MNYLSFPSFSLPFLLIRLISTIIVKPLLAPMLLRRRESNGCKCRIFCRLVRFSLGKKKQIRLRLVRSDEVKRPVT